MDGYQNSEIFLGFHCVDSVDKSESFQCVTLNDAGVPACFLLYSGKGVVLVYLMGHYDYDYTEQP